MASDNDQPNSSQVPEPSGPKPDAQLDRQAEPVDAEQPPRLAFAVVGIGASAGGLEAMIEFLSAVPPDSGMAYVFIQHLPPERESMLSDILSKKTKMTVRPVEDGLEVEPAICMSSGRGTC